KPGWKTDVRIVGFEREFLVHDVVLRLNSGFFRSALDGMDSGGGGGTAPAGNGWRHEFVAVDSMGGGWNLERSIERPRTPSPSPDLAPKDQHHAHSEQDLAFSKLLSAFYNKPFSISFFNELVTITHLADHFSALPCLSSALYVALWHSPVLVQEIRTNCKEMLLLAKKLRHALLFREALVHVVSR
ncbi:uncharacterized protein LY89DRAFT_548278, partial [Mollisia scopiformis]